MRQCGWRFRTCLVLLLGYPGVGKRTVGTHLAELLDGVLVDNQLINIPLLTLFRWDGKFPIPMEIWGRVKPIRAAVLGTIEDLAPKTNSYVFTNVLKDDAEGAAQYDELRSLARRRGSIFLPVMLDCDVEQQVRRIDTADRRARLKGSDPEGYRRHRQHTRLFTPPAADGLLRLDTTEVSARGNAEAILESLVSRGLEFPDPSGDNRRTGRDTDQRSSGRLVLICGLPASGKTTLARQLARTMPAIRLNKDEWVAQLGHDVWDDDFRVRLEERLWTLTQEPLANGHSVILEWGHWARVERDEKRLGAPRLGAGVELHYLDVPLEELIERAEGRNASGEWSASPITRAHFKHWATIFQPPDEKELLLFDEAATET